MTLRKVSLYPLYNKSLLSNVTLGNKKAKQTIAYFAQLIYSTVLTVTVLLPSRSLATGQRFSAA